MEKLSNEDLEIIKIALRTRIVGLQEEDDNTKKLQLEKTKKLYLKLMNCEE